MAQAPEGKKKIKMTTISKFAISKNYTQSTGMEWIEMNCIWKTSIETTTICLVFNIDVNISNGNDLMVMMI